MKTVKVMGKIDVIQTIKYNLKKKPVRSLRSVRKEMKKTERILAM